jgi:hypothetical protein
MTDDKKDRKEDLLDLGIPVDSQEPGEIQEEPQDEFEVYRSLGYLSTGDVLTETKLSKGELFYLLNTGFPLWNPFKSLTKPLTNKSEPIYLDTGRLCFETHQEHEEEILLSRGSGYLFQIELYSLVKINYRRSFQNQARKSTDSRAILFKTGTKSEKKRPSFRYQGSITRKR